MLDAFIAQTYDPHGGITSYEKKCAEVIEKSNEIYENWIQESKKQIGRSQEIAEYLSILSNLKNGELDEKTQSHPHFENYDHSLEIDRLAKLREKYNYVPPKNNTVDLSQLEMSTEPYENIDPAEVPNLNGIFDNVFGLD